ncbi:hypothetical protein [Kovacikia minuta]
MYSIASTESMIERSQESGGFGRGLAIVQQIIQAHGKKLCHK